MIAGINYLSNGNAWTESDTTLNTDFTRFEQDGIKHLSIRMMWSVMEPTNGTLSTTALNNLKRVLNAADAHGIKVNLDFWCQFGYTLGFPTSWAGDDYYDLITEPTKTYYLDYLTMVVNELKSYPAVESWSILNEPYYETGQQTAFESLIHDCADEIKAADSTHDVICRFTLSYTPASGKYNLSVYDNFDIVAITIYLNPDNPNDTRYNGDWDYWVDTVSQCITLGKRLWVIEFGDNSTDQEHNRIHYQHSLSRYNTDGVERAYAWAWQTGSPSNESFNIYSSGGVRPSYTELIAYGETSMGMLLHRSGNKFINTNGQTVILRCSQNGTFTDGGNGNYQASDNFHFSSVGYNTTWVNEQLDQMKAWGFNCIRIQLSVRLFKYDWADCQAHLLYLIQQAKARDMYAIVSPYCVRSYWADEAQTTVDGDYTQDPLPYPPWSNNGSSIIASIAEFVTWHSSLTNFLKNEDNVLFEVWNEAWGGSGQEDVPMEEFLTSVVPQCMAAARANGAQQPFLIWWVLGGAYTHWCPYVHGLSDQNLGEAWHLYPVYGHLGGNTTYSGIHSYLSAVLAEGDTYPCIVSETGIEYGNAASRSTEQAFLQVLYDHNFSWCAHWYRSGGGVFTYCDQYGNPTLEGDIFVEALDRYAADVEGHNFGQTIHLAQTFAAVNVSTVTAKSFSNSISVTQAFADTEVAVTTKAFSQSVAFTQTFSKEIPITPAVPVATRQFQMFISKPVPASCRDDFADPALTGWTISANCTQKGNGETIRIRTTNTTSGHADKTISINESTYRYLIVRYRALVAGTYTWLKIQDSVGLKTVMTDAVAPTEWTLQVIDLNGKTTGIQTQIQLGVNGGFSKEIEYDLFFFTTALPFYSADDLQRLDTSIDWTNSITEKSDTLNFAIDNHDGEMSDRIAYRDEVHVWVKKDTVWQRVFGGGISVIDPDSVAYGDEYLTINCLGWDAIYFKRNIAGRFQDYHAHDLINEIMALAEAEAPCGITSYGVKDCQKDVPILKADYDSAYSKLQETANQLDLVFHVEPNRDASLYPIGKRFLRFAGWMERYFEKGWGCSTNTFVADGSWATMTTASGGGSGTLQRTSVFSVNSLIYPYLIARIKGDSGTTYTVQIVTEDNAVYTIQSSQSVPSAATIKIWDVTSLITGSNKQIKNVKVYINKASSQGYLQLEWLGFFADTPDDMATLTTLDTASNIHTSTLQTDPEQIRNAILVKGDNYIYTQPLDPTENDDPTLWGNTNCTLTADGNQQEGTQCIKAVFNDGTTNSFQRKSSGLILEDTFNGTQINTGLWDIGSHSAEFGDGESYLSGGKLINEVSAIQMHNTFFLQWLITKALQDLSGCVIEATLGITAGRHASAVILTPVKHATGDILSNIDGLWISGAAVNDAFAWSVVESKRNAYFADYIWLSELHTTHYDLPASSSNPTSMRCRIIPTSTNVKVYMANNLVCNATRTTEFTNMCVLLVGATDESPHAYPSVDDFKLYKGLKIYVENVPVGWKIELYDGTYNTGDKVAEGTVPEGSSVAELDVSTLDFPFTGYFIVKNAAGTEDHHSSDYTDIWGGDIYEAQQVEVSTVVHEIHFPANKDLNLNALGVKKLKFWLKHDIAEDESARLILATDDNNYYYSDIKPTSTWNEQFEFDLGSIQNIDFQLVGNPQLTQINYVGIFYAPTSTVTTAWINGLHFELESESWGVANDEASIASVGYQPEKIFSSVYKTPAEAQQAAEYFLSILKNAPLLKGTVRQPWGQFPLYAGDSATVNVPKQNILNTEMVIKSVNGQLPPASSIVPMDIEIAGTPTSLTDPQKRVKEWIERLENADMYTQEIELINAIKDAFIVTDTATWTSTSVVVVAKSFSQTIACTQAMSLYGYILPLSFSQTITIAQAFSKTLVTEGTLEYSMDYEAGTQGNLTDVTGGVGSVNEVTTSGTPHGGSYHGHFYTESNGSYAVDAYDYEYWEGEDANVKLEFYFKYSGTISSGNFIYIAAVKNAAQTDALMVYIRNNGGTVYFGLEDTDDYGDSTQVCSQNTWYKVTVIRRATGTQELYINDVQKKTTTQTWGANVGWTTMGIEYNANGDNITVYIDDANWYSL